MISPELLRRFPFFGFLSNGQLKAVAMTSDEITVEKDECLLQSGQPAQHLHFLIDGSIAYYLSVTAEHDPSYHHEYYIGNINPGEIFGISALIEPYRYTATIRAASTCRVIRIEANPLRDLCENDNKLNVEFLRAITKAAMERLDMTQLELAAARV